MELLTELAQVKRSYDKIASALEASATGYGVVMPTGEMKLEAPEIVRKGSAYGVKLKAGAPPFTCFGWTWTRRSAPHGRG